MATPALELEQQEHLVKQWRETGRLLGDLRRRELALLSAEESRQATYDLLQLGGMLAPDSEREKTSGMVEMQRLFARARGA
jgi:hypothetical protein